MGSEVIHIDSIKAPLPGNVSRDATFIALRFSGKKPMVGFLDKEIFHIVWFAKDFDSVYDH